MNRRVALKLMGAAAIAAAIGLPANVAFAADPSMVVVVKIAGIPWFNALETGVVKAGKEFGIDASMVGPANVDPAQQVKLLEDLIAKKVTVIGLVPLDVKVTEPVLKRAQEAGIKVITHEGPEQAGRDWNVELIDSVKFGEVQMEKLAQEMGGEGEYVVYVGTLTTPLHNLWADAAIAYQKAKYPKMTLATDRFPGADEIDTAYKTTLDVIKAYPNLKGIIAFGSNGPIGGGNALREKRLSKKIALVGTALPSQAKPLLMDGSIRAAYLWNPVDAGYAMVAVAKLMLDGKEIVDGIEIPGLGKAVVDVPNKLIKVDKIMDINKDTVDSFIAQGL
ncbi:MAG: autoinducer 2 ABC transporter substrate-binding protein [Bauldia sp.]